MKLWVGVNKNQFGHQYEDHNKNHIVQLIIFQFSWDGISNYYFVCTAYRQLLTHYTNKEVEYLYQVYNPLPICTLEPIKMSTNAIC